MKGKPIPKAKKIPQIIKNPITIDKIHTPIAAANPVSCLAFITTQFRIQPIQGINKRSELINAVTNTAPNPVFLASANPSAIFKNMV